MVENIMRQKRLKIWILRYIITMHQGALGAQRTVMTDGDTTDKCNALSFDSETQNKTFRAN